MPVTPLMVELAAAVHAAGAVTGGLVDGTLVGALEASGYADDRPHAPSSDDRSPGGSIDWGPGAARAARPSAAAGWSTISVDRSAGVVHRPPACGSTVAGS